MINRFKIVESITFLCIHFEQMFTCLEHVIVLNTWQSPLQLLLLEPKRILHLKMKHTLFVHLLFKSCLFLEKDRYQGYHWVILTSLQGADLGCMLHIIQIWWGVMIWMHNRVTNVCFHEYLYFGAECFPLFLTSIYFAPLVVHL